MFKKSTHRVQTLRPRDADFTFSPDGIQMVSRAGIEISQRCPETYKHLILECINHGWIQPVAYMRDVEHTMELLRK